MSNLFKDPVDPYHQLIMSEKHDYARSTLTISDIQRLAQAGVSMTFEQIADQVRPDPPSAIRQAFDVDYLTDPIVTRWRASKAATESVHPLGVTAFQCTSARPSTVRRCTCLSLAVAKSL